MSEEKKSLSDQEPKSARFRSVKATTRPPRFDQGFNKEFEHLLRWRRDVRSFKTDPLPPGLLDELLDLACLAPSVGNAQPWRFVTVDAPQRRREIIHNFEQSNAQALAEQEESRRGLYARLKLSGLRDAPVHLAVYCDEETLQGHGLGKATMPETLRYSVTMAIHTLWLAARAKGVGLGWVSIIDPVAVDQTLEVPQAWDLVAYLCIGFPAEESQVPELERKGWQARTAKGRQVVQR
ncbi:5,6-dimethylbenzimidazole synthase [Rhodovibrionaceae bacterium A322]